MAVKSTKKVWLCASVFIAVVVLAILITSIRTDIDACPYTSKMRTRKYILGIQQSEFVEETEVTRWLRNEFNITGPVRFEDYLDSDNVVSTLPGNWVYLDLLKHDYETEPDSRRFIEDFIRKLYATSDPRIEVDAFNQLIAKYEKR